MERQLDLLPSQAGDEWRIDDETRAIGRRGLARARAALAEAQSRLVADATVASHPHAA